jgi:hypothetical protein
VRSVRLFDSIEDDGVSWQVVAQERTTIALKNLATNRIRRLPLLDLLGDESYLPDSPDKAGNATHTPSHSGRRLKTGTPPLSVKPKPTSFDNAYSRSDTATTDLVVLDIITVT